MSPCRYKMDQVLVKCEALLEHGDSISPWLAQAADSSSREHGDVQGPANSQCRHYPDPAAALTAQGLFLPGWPPHSNAPRCGLLKWPRSNPPTTAYLVCEPQRFRSCTHADNHNRYVSTPIYILLTSLSSLEPSATVSIQYILIQRLFLYLRWMISCWSCSQ